MKSSDKNVDPMPAKVARKAPRDPRRSPVHFRLHVALIVVLLVAGSVSAGARGRAGRSRGTALAAGLKGVAATGVEAGLSPLSGPPSRPISLDADLRATGYQVPANANVYAVRVVEGPE